MYQCLQELLCRLENGPVKDNFLQMLNSIAESVDHPPHSKLCDIGLQGRLRWLRNVRDDPQIALQAFILALGPYRVLYSQGIEEAAYSGYKEIFVRLCQLSVSFPAAS